MAIWIYRVIGAGLAIAAMESLARIGHQPLAGVPFVTTIVLTMGMPDSDPAQPYPVIAGHLLSSSAGFAVLWALGPGEVSSAVAVGFAALLMQGCRAMHPPAGIDAFLVAGLDLPTDWIINPGCWRGIRGSGRWANAACRARPRRSWFIAHAAAQKRRAAQRR